MVHISKNVLSEKQLKGLFQQLHAVLGKLKAEEIGSFLDCFLGPEEKIVLAKRLAAIIMLAHYQSTHKVVNTLHISSSTADLIRRRLAEGTYDPLLRTLREKKKRYIEVLETIDSILHLGGLLPHYGQTPQSEAWRRHQNAKKSFD
jgi:uncharacterized protein YerC